MSTIGKIKDHGVLKVGATLDYNPMSFIDPETGRYVGYDVELVKDLAAALDVDIEFVRTSWPTLIEDALSCKFDLAICGITITDERKKQALMSDPYLENGKTILCRAEDVGKYLNLSSINLPGVRVMVNPGGLNEEFARQNLPDATLMIHDVNQDIPGMIALGTADVMITEVVEANYYAGLDERLAAPLIQKPFTDGKFGILMPKGYDDLLKYVNEFLAVYKNSSAK